MSAPIEALRPELEAAYKRLDAKWKAVSDHLQKLLIPCDISYAYSVNEDDPSQYYSIDWRKWNGSRRICDVYHSEEMSNEGPVEVEKVTPYEEWGAEHRIDMLQYVPKLFEATADQTKKFIKLIQDKEE